MCRKQGRRCDAKWDDAHRERYNARRRITRNRDKAKRARAAGGVEQAAYYEALVDSAVEVERVLDAEISEHEALTDPETSTNATNATTGGDGGVGASRCGQCGQWISETHDCPQGRTLATLRANSTGWRDTWTPDEADAFDTYGGVDHYDINAKLRNGVELDDREAEIVRGLDSALDRAPQSQEEQSLYRSFGLAAARGDAPVDQWVEEHFPQGSTTTLDAYTSVTPDYSVAESFSEANSEYTDGGVLMEVRTGQGGYTADSPEKEVLLRRGTQVEVLSNGDVEEINGKRFRKVVLAEKTASATVQEHPLACEPAVPMEMPFLHNPVSSTTHRVNQDFGQDIEPAGRYVSHSEGFVPEGWESGTVRFERPLHLAFGESGLYTEDDNWKRRLSAHYGGKTGAALSDAVRADGYDGIVTHDEYGLSEIVDLGSSR